MIKNLHNARIVVLLTILAASSVLVFSTAGHSIAAHQSSCSGQISVSGGRGAGVIGPEYGKGCAFSGAGSSNGSTEDDTGVSLATHNHPSNCGSASAGVSGIQFGSSSSFGSVSCSSASQGR